MVELCRKFGHLLADRVFDKRGYRVCETCHTEAIHAKNQRRPGALVGWADPVADAERAARLQTWQDGVDAAIAEMRASEGFDGTEREWTTLGECLPPEPRRLSVAPAPVAPAPVARRTPVARFKPARVETPGLIGGHPFVRCERCKNPRFVGRDCASCAAGLVRRLVS